MLWSSEDPMQVGGYVVMSILVCSACATSVRNSVFYIHYGFHCLGLGFPTFLGIGPIPNQNLKAHQDYEKSHIISRLH